MIKYYYTADTSRLFMKNSEDTLLSFNSTNHISIFGTMVEVVFISLKKNVILKLRRNIHDLVFIVAAAAAMKNTSSVSDCDLFL